MGLRGFAGCSLQSETIVLAVQLFLSVSLALIIATAMGLHNPYWAGIPVWVISQSYREDLFFRAVLRIIGTIVGALIGLQLIWQVADPLILVGALAVLIGLCAGIAYWTGNAYSYGATVAGVTLAVVVLPSLPDHTQAMDYAIDRVICTLIGVICVTGITFAFTPLRNAARKPSYIDGHFKRTVIRGGMSMAFAFAGGILLVFWPRPELVAGAMTLAILTNLASSAVNAGPMLASLAPATAIGAFAAIVFRSVIPSLDNNPVLLILLTVMFLAAGALVRAHPRTHPLGIEVNISFLLITEVGTMGHNLTHTILAGLAMTAAATLIAITLSPIYRR